MTELSTTLWQRYGWSLFTSDRFLACRCVSTVTAPHLGGVTPGLHKYNWNQNQTCWSSLFCFFSYRDGCLQSSVGHTGPELPGLPGFIVSRWYSLLQRSLSQVCARLTDAHTWCRSWHSFIRSKWRLIQVLLIVADRRPFAVLLNGPIPVVTEALLPHHTKDGPSPSQENNIQLTKSNVKLQSRRAGCAKCRSLSSCHSTLSLLHPAFKHLLRSSFALHIHHFWRLVEDEWTAGPGAGVGTFLGAKDCSQVWQEA